MKTVCCLCHRIKESNGWTRGENDYNLSHLSHGYCPSCYRKFIRKVCSYRGIRPFSKDSRS